MSIFYAYIHNIIDDNTSRFVIIFANRSVADEWWRAVSMGSNAVLTNSIRRISPQFYTHNTNTFSINSFFTDQNVKSISDQFRGRMFFTLENDRGGRGITIIPPQDIVDHVSGNRFYIRSKTNPNLFWFYDHDAGIIRASSRDRTQFGIVANDVPNGTIMIGTDNINICIDDQYYVGTDACGGLVRTESPWELKFSAFENGRIKVSGQEKSELKFVRRDESKHESWVLA